MKLFHLFDLFQNEKFSRSTAGFDNNLILHIYIIIRKYYHTYFELIHAFYNWFWNNAE